MNGIFSPADFREGTAGCGNMRNPTANKPKEYLTRSQNTPDKISHLQPSKIRYLHRGPLRAGVASPHPKNNQKNPYILTGAAGAATGFARTFPMRDEPAGR